MKKRTLLIAGDVLCKVWPSKFFPMTWQAIRNTEGYAENMN